MRRSLPPKQPSLAAEFDLKPSRRLFFAIRPDIGATGRLTGLMERLCHDGIMPGRPVEPDQLHITLHHLGDFDDQMPQAWCPPQAWPRRPSGGSRLRSLSTVSVAPWGPSCCALPTEPER